MALNTAAQGAQGTLYVEPGSSAYTWNTSSERYEFVSETLQFESLLIDGADNIRGTRSLSKEVNRRGLEQVRGSIVMEPSPLDLDLWFPRILGANESSDTFALAETLQDFGILIDRDSTNHEYEDCWVSRAVFESEAGSRLRMTLDIVGADENIGTSAPAVSLGTAAGNAPYVHTDAVVTLGGTAYPTQRIRITIDNQVTVSHYNSVLPTSFTPAGRIITVETRHPYTSAVASALYAVAAAGLTTNSIVYTNGNMSTTFTFGNLAIPQDLSPNIPGKSEIFLERTFRAYMSGATKELVVTHDGNAAA